MNLKIAKNGAQKVFVLNMHLSWFIIVENLVELVVSDQV